jgi:serine protease
VPDPHPRLSFLFTSEGTNLPTHIRRALGISAAAAVACSGLFASALPAAASATAAGVTGGAAAGSTHPYRHGAVPQRGAHRASTAVAAASANNLSYGGGVDGIGVTTGQEKVYLVFWGSQWGSQSTNSAGYATFSGDPSGAAPYMQGFFKGLGTNGETWSGVMTQYCQGVAAGAQSCPSSNQYHVAYPTGGALAGVWEDASSSAPSAASGHQLAQEAVKAAGHFGNTTAAANRNAQYVIYSPTGTDPDGWRSGGFCAWHDWNGDSTLSGGAASSSYGDIAFTNMPYVTDAGASCGAGFVNSPGTRDGFSIVGGHEYAETITDQNPAGGYLDSSGEENGDKCAWINPGSQGGSQNITLGTGSYAVQSTWANDYNGGAGGCEVSHPIVANGGGGTGSSGQLIGAQSGKCLDTYGNHFANGTKEEIWTCNGGAGQNWTYSGGKLTVDGGAYCLEASGSQTANGTIVDLWSCTGGQNQQWTFNADGSITGVQSGKCLDVTGASTANGTQVELWSCNGGSNQKWAW